MLTILVQVDVKADCVEAFKAASLENAAHSLREPGVAGFELLQQADIPNRFLLIETYRTDDAPAHHKETAHYKKWRDAVADMMATPRSSLKFRTCAPAEPPR